MRQIVESANAKINLTLDVMSKRPDNYHEVKMIMQSISLADTITLCESDAITLHCSNPFLPTDDRNLAVKAAKAILHGSGKGVAMYLEKLIPVEAGLAGGSSDAAAVLRGINKLYNLGKTQEQLKEIAVRLGADVPFCLLGGTALAEGIGERLTALPSIPKLWLVLVKPHFGVSTAEVYGALRLTDITAHPDTGAMLEAINTQNSPRIIAGLHNVLEQVTLKIKPVLVDLKNNLLDLGAENVLMSGSGPTVFGVFREEERAKKAAQLMELNKLDAFFAHTI